jgi:hypothetical protein
MLFAQQVFSGDRLNLGLREMAILAGVLIVMALFTKPEAVLDHLRGLLGRVLPFVKPSPVVEEYEPPEFLELHAALTELSLSQGGLYNQPLADMYQLYLKQGAKGETDAAKT